MTTEPIKKSRRIVRQKKNALKAFNYLWNEFIEFETTNSMAIGGYMTYQNTVANKIKDLHNRWSYFAKCKIANPKKVGFSPEAFKLKVEQYILNKDKQIWVSYSMQIAFQKFGFKAPIKDFEESYKAELLPLPSVKLLIQKSNPMLTLNLSFHQMLGKYKKEVKFPESFAELTRKQFLSFMELAGKGMTDYEIKIQFLRDNFFKLPIGRIQAHKRFAEKEKSPALASAYYEGWLDNSSSIHQLIKLLDFLSGTPEIKINPVPAFGLLKGPSDELKNISIWEFALAEKAMFDFAADKDVKHLDILAGILMRRRSVTKTIKSWFTFVDDTRTDFHDQELIKLAKRASKLPEHYKYAILAFFRTIREGFTNVFPNVYSNVKKSGDAEEGNWGDVIMSFSGEVPGKEDEVADVNLYTFLYRVDKLIADQQKRKDKLKK